MGRIKAFFGSISSENENFPFSSCLIACPLFAEPDWTSWSHHNGVGNCKNLSQGLLYPDLSV